jgi:hypothetical protein
MLLATFPSFQTGDAEAALTAYQLVIAKEDQRDLQDGVMLIIDSRLPGHDGRFAPTAPQLARAIRICRDKRIEAETKQAKLLTGASPSDDWLPNEAQRARGRQVLEKLSASLTAQLEADQEAPPERVAFENEERRQRWQKINDRFRPDPSPEALAARLGIPRQAAPTPS